MSTYTEIEMICEDGSRGNEVLEFEGSPTKREMLRAAMELAAQCGWRMFRMGIGTDWTGGKRQVVHY